MVVDEQVRRETGEARAPRPPRFRTVALACCLVALLVGVQVWHARPARADGGVTFLHRDYDVRVQANGDLAVTEMWETQFTGGPYQSATLGIYLANTTGVAIGPITGADASSEKVSDVEDKSANVIRQITWTFPPARDTTRIFTIPYTVHGALGVSGARAWLDWHFLDGPGRSSIPVAASQVTITLPTATSASDVRALATYPGATVTPAVNAGLNAGQVTLANQNLNSGQSLEVQVTFPRSQLATSYQRPRWQQADTPPTLPSALGGGHAPAAPATSPSDPFGGGLFSALTLILGVVAVAVALLAILVWRRMRRAKNTLPESAHVALAADGDVALDDGEINYSTRPLPAIDISFEELALPPVEPDDTIASLRLPDATEQEFDRIDSAVNKHLSYGPERRGTDATSGVGAS